VTLEAFSDGMLGWLVRLAGLFWLVGAGMLFRQIRTEMALDAMTSKLEKATRELEPSTSPEPRHKSEAERAEDRWTDRDDAARRGWIAGQAVVLAATAIAMLMLHPFAAWMVAFLVMGQGAYFIWREHTARRAPSARAADHARPSVSTINAGWVSLFVAGLVWMAAYRGLLA
jgi:hypothetical protein